VLVQSAAGLLGRHAGLGGSVAGGLGLHVLALGLMLGRMLGRRRGGAELLAGVLLLLGVHGLLLLLLEGGGVWILVVGGGVRVLVVDGRLGLAGDVGRLGVLLHGDCEMLVGCLLVWIERIGCDGIWLWFCGQRQRLVNTSRGYSVGALEGRLEGTYHLASPF
jgi:hypothetical protein